MKEFYNVIEATAEARRLTQATGKTHLVKPHPKTRALTVWRVVCVPTTEEIKRAMAGKKNAA